MPLSSAPPAPESSGPVDDFVSFQQLVIDEAGLFAQLQSTASTEAFVALAVELGASHGLTFDADHVHASLQAARRAWIERSLA